MMKTVIFVLFLTCSAVIPWNNGFTSEDNGTNSRFAEDHIIVKLNSVRIIAASFIPDNELNIISGICSS